MPKSSLQRQAFNQKKPYLAASVFCLIFIVFIYGWFYQRVAIDKEAALEDLKAKVAPLQQSEQRLRDAMGVLKRAESEAGQFQAWMKDRLQWAELLVAMREALIAVEAKKQQEFGRSVGVWVERLNPNAPDQFLVGCGSGAAKSPAPPPPPPIPGRGGATQAVTSGLSESVRIWDTSSAELAEIANTVKPGLLVTYHRAQLPGEPHGPQDVLVEEIQQAYGGKVLAARDLDIF